MDAEQIRRLFPNASASVFAANAETGSAVPHPKPQRHKAPALDKAVPGKEESLRRTVVRFTLYRVRLLDPDNAAGSCKDLLDGLRHAKILEGDEWYRIKLEVEQEKVSKYAQERTEIEVSASSSSPPPASP